jgi:2-oxo-4-hydroxy-4-carboxy-5-ureidoimidazoline decarboxylase
MGQLMNKTAFRKQYGAVYEHSPWVAEDVFDTGVDSILSDIEALSASFERVFMQSDVERQLAVLRAHPELACGRADPQSLTRSSRQEQAGSGLDQCSELEFKMFRDMNNKYMIKNKFPFIIAVKGRTRKEILGIFKQRLNNDSDKEFHTALQQVCQIGRFRIGAILGE